MSTLRLAATFLLSLFKSRQRLTLENLALRLQVSMMRQSVEKPRPSVADKLFWKLFSRYVDGWRQILYSLHTDTVVRWHRQVCRANSYLDDFLKVLPAPPQRAVVQICFAAKEVAPAD